jgi:hypothetical protein
MNEMTVDAEHSGRGTTKASVGKSKMAQGVCSCLHTTCPKLHQSIQSRGPKEKATRVTQAVVPNSYQRHNLPQLKRANSSGIECRNHNYLVGFLPCSRSRAAIYILCSNKPPPEEKRGVCMDGGAKGVPMDRRKIRPSVRLPLLSSSYLVLPFQ